MAEARQASPIERESGNQLKPENSSVSANSPASEIRLEKRSFQTVQSTVFVKTSNRSPQPGPWSRMKDELQKSEQEALAKVSNCPNRAADSLEHSRA